MMKTRNKLCLIELIRSKSILTKLLTTNRKRKTIFEGKKEMEECTLVLKTEVSTNFINTIKYTIRIINILLTENGLRGLTG